MRTGLDRLAGLLGRLGSLIARLVGGIGLGHSGPASEPANATAPVRDFLTVSGVVLHYLDTGGSGPPLVLLHGNGGMIADMESSGLVDLAAKRYRVVVFDRPGYGHSARPRGRVWTPEAQAGLIDQACERLGLVAPVILGHSWGALVAVALAIDKPQRVGGLVLASGFYFPEARLDVWLFAPPALPVIGDIMRHTILPPLARAILPTLIRKVFAPQAPTARFGREFSLDMALRSSQLRASAEEAMLMIPAASRLRRRYRDIRHPAIVVAGTADEIVDTDRQSVPLGALLPNAELRLLSGLGHMIHHFAAGEILRGIDRVAERMERRAPGLSISGSARPAVPGP